MDTIKDDAPASDDLSDDAEMVRVAAHTGSSMLYPPATMTALPKATTSAVAMTLA